MEQLKTYDYSDSQKIASAIESGRNFLIKHGNHEAIVSPFVTEDDFTAQERIEIDAALARSEADFAAGRVTSHDDFMAELDSIIAQYE